jgi:hypothetical protein
MFAGCAQIAQLRLPGSAESLRRKTVHIGGSGASIAYAFLHGQ